MATEGAVIVGAGLMGGLVAEILSRQGVANITVLEVGPCIEMRNRRTWLDVVTTGTVPYSKLYDDLSDFDATGVEPWNIVGGRLFGRGGSTVHWGGWAPRFFPEDFEQFSRTGSGADWPYSYDDLEPYYGLAEAWLQVAGHARAGQRDWRSSPYPMSPPPLPVTAAPVVAALEGLGLTYEHMPVARNSEPINGQPQCRTITTCQYCPIGARFTGDQPFDRLQSSGAVRLLTNKVATKVEMASRSRAAGISYLDTLTGATEFLEADQVFLCAGALEVPKLLLASRSRWWPEGLGNDHGLIGANLVANPYLYCRGTSASNPMRWQQEVSFPTLCTRDFDSPEEQSKGKFLMNMSSASPVLKPANMMFIGQQAPAVEAAVTGEVRYELQGGMSAFPSRRNRVSIAPGSTRFGLPRTRIEILDPLTPAEGIQRNIERMRTVMNRMGFSTSEAGAYPQRGDHAAATCGMGGSPETSAVDQDLRIWEVQNVSIASNAVLPAIGAANLTLTTVAVVMKTLSPVQGSPAPTLRSS